MQATHSNPPLMAMPIEDTASKKLACTHLLERFGAFIKAQADVDAINTSEFAKKVIITGDIRPYLNHLKRKENHLLMSKTMQFLILRQAHFPLMQALFGVTRHEVTKLRKQCNAPAPTKAIQHLSDQERELIYLHWRQVDAQYADPIDKWAALATVEALSRYPLSAMYALINE